MPPETDLEALYRKRASRRWLDRLLRLIQPPAPFILNPREPKDFPLGRWNLYIGGAGRVVDGYINLDLFAIPGVNVAADAAQLPFPTGIFQRVECDAVLELKGYSHRRIVDGPHGLRPAKAHPLTPQRSVIANRAWPALC